MHHPHLLQPKPQEDKPQEAIKEVSMEDRVEDTEERHRRHSHRTHLEPLRQEDLLPTQATDPLLVISGHIIATSRNGKLRNGLSA